MIYDDIGKGMNIEESEDIDVDESIDDMWKQLHDWEQDKKVLIDQHNKVRTYSTVMTSHSSIYLY